MTYDEAKAEDYWSRRLAETDELAAVLSYSLPDYLNQAYSDWETEVVVRAVSPIEGRSVVDVGCGVGRVTALMAKHGGDVTAFDNSAEMLQACRKRVTAEGLADRVSFEKGSAARLPFTDHAFDIVLCLGVLEHLPAPERKRSLAEICRVAAVDGTVVLVVNNTASRLLASEQRYRMQEQQDNGYFVGLIGREMIESVLREAGFSVELAGSNLFHSVLKDFTQKVPALGQNRPVAEALARVALQADLSYPLKGDLDVAFADQWVVVAKRNLG